MNAPHNHAQAIVEYKDAADEELAPWWRPEIQPTQADCICAAVEKWALVLLFLLCALAFFATGHGLLTIASLAFAGLIARRYERYPS